MRSDGGHKLYCFGPFSPSEIDAKPHSGGDDSDEDCCCNCNVEILEGELQIYSKHAKRVLKGEAPSTCYINLCERDRLHEQARRDDSDPDSNDCCHKGYSQKEISFELHWQGRSCGKEYSNFLENPALTKEGFLEILSQPYSDEHKGIGFGVPLPITRKLLGLK